MEYVRRDSFQTWFADVGVLYVAVAVFVTVAVLFGSLAGFVGSSSSGRIESRPVPVEYLGPEAHGLPSPYP